MIESSAPVTASAQIEVEASLELVWEVITAVQHWPAWNPDVRSVSQVGPVTPGAEFRWRVIGGVIASTFREVEQPHLLTWIGRMSPTGIQAEHSWRLEARDGRTLVTTEESWKGRLPRLMSWPSRSLLQWSLNRGLAALKRECERRARLAGAPEKTPQEDT